MATNKRRNGPLMPWLQHHRLIASEALLIAGIVQQLLGNAISASGLPGWVKVLVTMATVVGLLSIVAVAAQTIANVGLVGTHRALARTLQVPQLLLHLLILVGLFFAYALVWRIPVHVPVIGVVG
jgi:hypothetical protein